MAFDIHVAGSGGFRYSRSGVLYGDEWDLGWITTKILSRAGVSARPSATGSSVRTLMAAASHINRVHLLVTTIELLMANHGNGTLNVAVRHSHVLWPTTGGYRSIALSGGSGGPVAIDLCRFLHANDMNKWGPIIEILAALVDFDRTYGGGSGYMINVTLYD